MKIRFNYCFILVPSLARGQLPAFAWKLGSMEMWEFSEFCLYSSVLQSLMIDMNYGMQHNIPTTWCSSSIYVIYAYIIYIIYYHDDLLPGCSKTHCTVLLSGVLMVTIHPSTVWLMMAFKGCHQCALFTDWTTSSLSEYENPNWSQLFCRAKFQWCGIAWIELKFSFRRILVFWNSSLFVCNVLNPASMGAPYWCSEGVK